MDYQTQQELVAIKSNIAQIQMLLARGPGTAASKMALENLAKQTEAKLLACEGHIRQLTAPSTLTKVNEAVKEQARDIQSQLARFQALQAQITQTMRAENVALERKLQQGLERPPEDTSPLLAPTSPLQTQETQEELQGLIDLNNYIMQERHAGVQQVSGTMSEVNEIFRDLGLLVSEQGDCLVEINESIESSANRSRHATEQLEQANERRKRRSWTVAKFLLAFMVGFLVIWSFLGIL